MRRRDLLALAVAAALPATPAPASEDKVKKKSGGEESHTTKRGAIIQKD